VTATIDAGTAEETLTFAGAINSALDLAMAKDPTVVVIGEDIADNTGGGVFKCTQGLSTRYGTTRVRTTPISEQAIMGAAVGAAIAGLRPVAEIMLMNFITLAMDQLSNHAAKLRYMSGGQTNVPLTVRCATGAGTQFGAQHSEMLEAWLTHVPGLNVAIASNPADAKGLLTACILDDDPCVFIEPTLGYFSSGPVPSGEHIVPLGKASVCREGTDVTLITWGLETSACLTVAKRLEEEASVEVIDLRSLVPLDTEAVLTSVAKTGRCVIVHQAVRRSGYGAELAALINEELFGQLHAPVLRVTGPNTPIPYAFWLEQAFLPSNKAITEAVKKVLG
jgi:pyruvate dehydrogenase E1 component beta subunit